MQLLVIRHAIAELKPEEGGTQQDDSLRELTAKGRKRMKAVARGLRKVHADIALLASSPLVRAVETAQIVSAVYKVPVRTVPELAPGVGAKAVMSWLRGLEADGTVAIVGHEPDLSTLGQHVLGAPHPVLVLKKGGAFLLDLDGNGEARFEWLATPRMLREAGG